MDPFAANQSPVADDAQIVTRYPLPLARGWQRVLVAAPRPSVHHEALLVLAETLTNLLGGIAIAAYTQRGATADPTLNRSLRSLRRPTWGQWLGWVRGALAALPPDEAPVPGLAAAYEATDTNLLLLGYEGLRGQMVVYLGYTGDYGHQEAASTRLLLGLINQYQLRLATHPPAPDSGWDPMGIVTVLAPGLRAALGRLSLLADYPLLGLVRDADEQVQVLRLSGFSATESSVELEPDVEPPGTLLLADPDELPLLVLDPWLVFARCPECDDVQVAAFAGQEGAQVRYRGLDCGHSWEVEGPPALVTLDLEAAEAGWVPETAVPPEVPTDVQEALFVRFEQEQQAMAAERAAVRGQRLPRHHIVTAEELDAQTRALRRQIGYEGGDRRIAPEQALMPEEEARLLDEHRRLEALQEEAERRFEDHSLGST
jgi:hypothetical protein